MPYGVVKTNLYRLVANSTYLHGDDMAPDVFPRLNAHGFAEDRHRGHLARFHCEQPFSERRYFDPIEDENVGPKQASQAYSRVLCSRLEILPMLFIVHCGQVTSLHNVTAKAYSEQVISISIQSSIRVRQHRIGR